MEVEDLIAEMQKVKIAYPALEIPDVLTLFYIKALIELKNVIQTKG